MAKPFLKQHPKHPLPDGSFAELPYVENAADPHDWVAQPVPHIEPNLRCGCGCAEFRVCWWDYPWTGGYCRVVCVACGDDLELIDDYA